MGLMSVVLLLVMGAAGLCFVLSTATHSWQVWSDGDAGRGIWKVCVVDICGNIRVSLNPDALRAVRGFMILAILFQGVLLLVALLRVIKIVGQNHFLPIVICGMAATACAIVGLAVYAAELKINASSFGWSFFIGWVGVVVNVVAVVLTALKDRS